MGTNAGGNTSSSKKGYKNYRGSSQFSHDIKHINASEMEDDLKIDAPHGEEDKPDINYGMSLDGHMPSDVNEETQGTTGWDKASAGPGVTNRGAVKVSGSKDPFPGGGW